MLKNNTNILNKLKRLLKLKGDTKEVYSSNQETTSPEYVLPTHESVSVEDILLAQETLDTENLQLITETLGAKEEPKEFESLIVDQSPWNHPYLNEKNIQRFRDYSESVWQFAIDYHNNNPRPIKVAFMVNLVQSMYKWARMAQGQGVLSTLYLHPQDNTALSTPEWEDFDGEYQDVMDRDGFLSENPQIKSMVPCKRILMDGNDLSNSIIEFHKGNRKSMLSLMASSPEVRPEVLMGYQGFYPYYEWAKDLAEFDVLYAASLPMAAYASGRPYCTYSVGGDLQYACVRKDDYGELLTLSFNSARFLLHTNPHTLAQCRQIGFKNSLYLPYPMDDDRYCPGEGMTRKVWEQLYGPGIYVLITSRVDKEAKGQDENFFQTLVKVASDRPEVRFIFLAWGNHVNDLREWIRLSDMQSQFIVLNPVGKKRLIDYYRSSDLVLDQFVYGYHGATGLEAASIGKPIVMKLRTEHLHPWYKGDYMPAYNAGTNEEIYKSIIILIDNRELRHESGRKMREWLVRNHGAERTLPLLISILRITADRIPLPSDLVNPLWDDETEEEREYYRSLS